MPGEPETEPTVELTTDLAKVCYVIIKARAFDAKVDVVEPDVGSNPADEDMREVLEDYADDPTLQELRECIETMNEDEQVDLVALLWLGRGEQTAEEWEQIREEASLAHTAQTAEYLIGTPQLGDYLEEGLAKLGFSCEDFEMNRL